LQGSCSDFKTSDDGEYKPDEANDVAPEVATESLGEASSWKSNNDV
jgi:hypothetical protein